MVWHVFVLCLWVRPPVLTALVSRLAAAELLRGTGVCRPTDRSLTVTQPNPGPGRVGSTAAGGAGGGLALPEGWGTWPAGGDGAGLALP